MKPNNPFIIYGYHSPEYFCERKTESDKIVQALLNERNLTLVSPRRMGKTGLIKHVFHLLHERQPETVTLYMDIYSTQNLGDFVRLFANTVLGQLDSAPQKALKRISQFIKSCRLVLGLDEMTGAPKITIDVAPNEEEATLKEIFEYLGSSEKRCYIAIDEFQQITEYPEKGVEALLRSYIQFVPNVKFIFSGSKRHVMEEMFMSAKRPFYQSTQTQVLGSIDPEKYWEFADRHFAEAGRHLSGEVFADIYNRYEGHTWYVQCILNRLYGYPEMDDSDMIPYAVSEIIAENEYLYENMLAAYPPGSIRLLKAIAKEGYVREILGGEFIAKYGLKAASSVSVAVRKLVDSELVYKGPKGYIIYDRFMGEWLRRLKF